MPLCTHTVTSVCNYVLVCAIVYMYLYSTFHTLKDA